MHEGDNVRSSILTSVEGDLVVYLKGTGKRHRAQFHALGNEFNLPVTSVGVTEMFSSRKDTKMTLRQQNVNFVCVSLARPFLPWLSSHLDKPRCYATLSGVAISNGSNVVIL